MVRQPLFYLVRALALVSVVLVAACASPQAPTDADTSLPLAFRLDQALRDRVPADGAATAQRPTSDVDSRLVPPRQVALALGMDARSVAPAADHLMTWLHAQGHDDLTMQTHRYVSPQRFALITSRERRAGQRAMCHLWALVRAPVSSDLEREVLHAVVQRARERATRGDDCRMHVIADPSTVVAFAPLFANDASARWTWLWLIADGRRGLSSAQAKWNDELTANATRVETIVGTRGFSLRGVSASARFDALLHAFYDAAQHEDPARQRVSLDESQSAQETVVLSLGSWLLATLQRDCPTWTVADGVVGLSDLPVLTDARGAIIRPFSFVRARISGQERRSTQVYRAQVSAQCGR